MRFEGEDLKLSDDPEQNYISLNNEDYKLEYLSRDFESNKGASSNVFILIDPNGDLEDRVIKICKTPFYERSKNKRIKRFQREIDAFRIVKQHHLANVIRFYSSGIIRLDRKQYLYIIMEKADSDLASYLEDNKFAFTPNQKLSICVSILNGIKQLHDHNIYHRDIKHDNILVVNGQFKICDLGLVDFRNTDFALDKPNEKIGPIGWLSPEATNKMLTFRKSIGNTYDCVINHKSDIFQLGKLFWYVFQGNLPVGQLKYDDCKFKDQDLYNLFFLMLQHKKDDRPEIATINIILAPIKLRLAV